MADTGDASCSVPDASRDPPAASDVPDAADTGVPNDGGCAVVGALVSYLQTTTLDTNDTRCGPISNGSCTIDLKGYLFVPQGVATPAPTIVFNHGSELLPGAKCSIADYFVSKGYVVFVPHRRGQGQSTGLYIGNYTCPAITYLQEQVADVTAAWNYVKGLTASDGGPVVDPTRMAIMGHSYGGIMTLLTNATSLGQVAAVDLCGDSESWNGPTNATSTVPVLNAAVDHARSPIFFAQPSNDVATQPTIDFSNRAGIDGQQFQATIYPPVPDAGTPEEAHTQFVEDPNEVAQWGSAALDFLHRYGM
jgi:dienelactone hydrolase